MSRTIRLATCHQVKHYSKSLCKVCYRQNPVNREKARIRSAAYYSTHSDSIRQVRREYYHSHKDQIKKTNKLYLQAHPGLANHYQIKSLIKSNRILEQYQVQGRIPSPRREKRAIYKRQMLLWVQHYMHNINLYESKDKEVA